MFVEGNVSASKSENVQNFKKQFKTIMEGINPRTAGVELSAKIGPGEDYKVIKGVVNVKTGDEEDIIHKPGQVFLLDFWATWCPPCQAPMAHN